MEARLPEDLEALLPLASHCSDAGAWDAQIAASEMQCGGGLC
jgi:hypothetical protein